MKVKAFEVRLYCCKLSMRMLEIVKVVTRTSKDRVTQLLFKFIAEGNLVIIDII